MPDKVPISVVVLTKNSRDIIEDCLKSVHGWADEIVVVDDLSSDATLDIVKKYTNKIFVRKWVREGEHRNWAYAQARHQYIFSLDSDERMTEGLREEIALIMREGPKFNGYNVPHRNFIGNYWIRYGGWYPNAKLKMFRRELFKYEEEAEYHPRAFMEGPRLTLKNDLIHYAYRDFENLFQKINYQTWFEARKWVRDGRKMSFGLCLVKMFSRFMKSYFSKKGKKDGFIGFMMAYSGALYQLMAYAKYWELKNTKCAPGQEKSSS